ncbi:MAG: NUDIX hydrolase N-terminal domain-containing protein [Chloroflexi bacterium]|nr:NUDIX hydrolase N-terminal domain-containing protein [Chloroflexota bacterium]
MNGNDMTPAEQIALWADRIRDMAAMGLLFSQNVYDRTNYENLRTMAMAMNALATGESLEQMEPLRATIFARPTPFAVGDAAVIDDAGRILLIRRADNRLWAMPGGALEVGETPAEGVVREAFEEAGVRSRVIALVGVFDSRLCGTVARFHLYQFIFLCRPLDTQLAKPSHALEVLDAQWFAENALPRDLDPGHATRIPEAFRVWRGDHRAFFDREGSE